MDIHIRSLKDKQQFLDEDQVAEHLGINSTLWSIFGVIWDSSQILARYMHDFQIEGKKILEVGGGLGLTSLVLNQRLADITCTDYHPEVGNFLEVNTSLNSDRAIPYFQADWANITENNQKFDLIIGSDLLYEANHAVLLSTFLESYAKDNCEIIIVDPGRRHLKSFTTLMKALSYSHQQEKFGDQNHQTSSCKGTINRYVKGKLD